MYATNTLPSLLFIFESYQVHVFKPATSKAGNSEVYVVCENYNGKEQLSGHMAALRKVFGK